MSLIGEENAEEDEERAEPACVRGVVLSVWDATAGHFVARTGVAVDVPGLHLEADGLLHANALERDEAPDPEPLWVQERLELPAADRHIHGEPVLEIWHGTPAQPSLETCLILARDRPGLRNPAGWRARLGPVAFSMGVRANLEAPRLVIYRAMSDDTPPDVSLGDAGAMPVIVVSIPGAGLFRAHTTGRVVQGAAEYVLGLEQVAWLRSALSRSPKL